MSALRRIPLRAIPAILLFLGNFTNYIMRVSINFAIISMTQNATDLCNDTSSSTHVINPESGDEVFCWSEHQKSYVKGAFYYGYIFLQIPGGRLAEVFGTRKVLGLATLVSAFLMALSPHFSLVSVWMLIIARVLIGLVQGVLFPSMNPMIVRWTAQTEQSKFYALATMGGTFGTIFIYPICGLILDNYNWKAVFYVSALVALLWCTVWFLMVADDPAHSKIISKEELDFVLANRIIPVRRERVPYLKIIMNKPVLVLIFCSFANDWGLYMLLTEGPNFLTNVLNKDLATIGFLSALPYIGRFLGAQSAGVITDALVSRPNLISRLNVRRLMFSIAFLSPAIGLATMGYLTVHWHFCIAVMTICFTFNGFNVGAFISIIDIGPAFSGTVFGFVNGLSAIAGFIVPIVTASITQADPSDPDKWKLVFFSGTCIYISAVVAYFIFGSVTPQPFNDLIVVDQRQRPDDPVALSPREEEEPFLS